MGRGRLRTLVAELAVFLHAACALLLFHVFRGGRLVVCNQQPGGGQGRRAYMAAGAVCLQWPDSDSCSRGRAGSLSCG